MSTDKNEVTNSDTEPSKQKIDWDDIPAEKQHELLALAETTGSDDPERDAKKSIGRRTFLGAGATAGAGFLGLLAGQAQADSNQSGTYGADGSPGDFYGEDMFLVQQTDLSTPPAGHINFGAEGTTPKYKLPNGTESVFGGVENPMQQNLDAAGNDITGVGSVSTDSVDTGGTITLDGTEDLGTVLSNNPSAVIDLNGHTFEFSSFERPEPVTLRNGTLKQADGADISSFFNDGKAIDGMTLENVTFDGNIANNTTKPKALQFTSGKASNLTVRDCEFVECEITIYFNFGAENIVVENSRFQDCTKAVLANGDTHGFTARGNVLAGSGEDGFVTTDTQGANEAIRYIDNELDENDPFHPTRYTYRVNDATTVRVRGNTADSTAEYYNTYSTGGSADNISITNCADVVVASNHVKRSGDMCLTVENSTDIRVVLNECENADAWGISCLNNTDGTIGGNICKNNAQNYSGRVLAVEVGISVNNSTDITLGRNRCYDDQGTSTQEYGMAPYRGTTDWVIVTDNILRGNGTGAITGSVPTNSVQADNLT